MPLHYLMYESHATRQLAQADLLALLAQARHFNHAQGLTGLLLYTATGHFVQVLEGEAATLADLYARIERDSRHQQVHLLAFEPLAARRFPTWHLGFRHLAADWPADAGYVTTENAAFLLPLLPALPSALLDKLLDYVHGPVLTT